MKKIITILLMGMFLVGCSGGIDKTITDSITTAIKKCAGDPECQKQVVEVAKKVAEQMKK
jgi:PBP1b-binding outer membrane lipoprotein LpoB